MVSEIRSVPVVEIGLMFGMRRMPEVWGMPGLGCVISARVLLLLRYYGRLVWSLMGSLMGSLVRCLLRCFVGRPNKVAEFF